MIMVMMMGYGYGLEADRGGSRDPNRHVPIRRSGPDQCGPRLGFESVCSWCTSNL